MSILTTRSAEHLLWFALRGRSLVQNHDPPSGQVNRPLESNASGDLTSATGTAGIRYKPLEWMDVHLSGSGTRQSGDGTLGSDLTRYSAILGVTVSNTYNIY